MNLLILVNIHEPEANNCFSIITLVIIEIPKQRIERKMLNFIFHCHASMDNYANRSHGLIHHMVKTASAFRTF